MSFEDGGAAIGFDEDGPAIGRIRLVRRTALGYMPRPLEELAKVFALSRDAAVDLGRLDTGLASLCHAMNRGDLCLAGLLATRLLIRPLSPPEMDAAHDADGLLKAAVDDPKHPGYPAKTPDDKGGEFRPKDGDGVSFVDRRAAKLKRLGQRRGFRAALRRVLTSKRLVRLAEKNAIAAATEEVPGLDAATTAAALAEDMSFIEDIAAEVTNSEAAIKFLEESTGELSDITLSSENLGFSSFGSFKKADGASAMLDLVKYFGDAGDGFDYHHIVEQGPNAGVLPETVLQSTENIVKIPKLLHEEINSIFATPRELGGKMVLPREYLRGQSYEEKRAFGLQVLREVGILH